ncbi:YceI family protein [Pseudogemmatithrix spongiicola]|uniref:YceI family protein n=1 Tax=Pseudogemmatithrix spongiicola TaxID=3062599 RepID=A0AA49Q8U1_9BACT|nr:YceI family protein [Gemmatimonadaceae bacterium 'strain 138']WKW16124.1 YceI family protein [Gemmatimonadaceae bacterium 'strain 318']
MKRIALALILAPALVAATPASAPERFVRDVAHSQLNFVAESRLLSAHGTFQKWDAEIMFDAANVEATSLKITIDATSIDTRIERRDAHLKSNDFFATDSFPQITFVSTFVNNAGEGNRLRITGDLTVRGKTKRITIPARLNFFDPQNNMGRVTGEFTIDRTEFGVSFQSPVNPIENEVKVQFDVAFNKPRN